VSAGSLHTCPLCGEADVSCTYQPESALRRSRSRDNFVCIRKWRPLWPEPNSRVVPRSMGERSNGATLAERLGLRPHDEVTRVEEALAPAN
jgi:hypothetical protein